MTDESAAPLLEAGALESYLTRIGFDGPIRADYETLVAVHRAHLTRISYENLDIHFGRPLSLDLKAIHTKIVTGERGGWCFEMNSLLRWALSEIGFDVTLLSGTAAFEGDHMLLLVETANGRYLADMGWGNGFPEPLPLVEGPHRQGFRRFELHQSGDRWRFANLDFGDDGFTFTLAPRQTHDFAERSEWLQRAPESSFVRVVKGFRFGEAGELHMMRGAVLTTLSESGRTVREMGSASEFEEVWRDLFRSPVSNLGELWRKVHADHLEWRRAKDSTFK